MTLRGSTDEMSARKLPGRSGMTAERRVSLESALWRAVVRLGV